MCSRGCPTTMSGRSPSKSWGPATARRPRKICCGRCTTKWISFSTTRSQGMYGEDKFRKFVEKHPHHHKTFFNRPHFTRRQFFEVVGAGVTGSYLVGQAPAAQIVQTLPVTPKGTAKNVIFILLAGAPSHTDTFDFKMVNGVTPAATKPDTFNGIVWPTGIFP